MAAPPANTGITWGRAGYRRNTRLGVSKKYIYIVSLCSRFEGCALALGEVNVLAIVYMSRCSLFATHNTGREEEVDGHGAGEELDAREERQG